MNQEKEIARDFRKEYVLLKEKFGEAIEREIAYQALYDDSLIRIQELESQLIKLQKQD